MRAKQRDRMREFFKARPNLWIPLPDILALYISQYGRVIHELRAEGMDIKNDIKEVINGQKRTAFKYVPKIKGDLF